MLTRPEAATLALFARGGDRERVDTEEVAVEVENVAPGMFVWKKYRDRIDKELVRVALSDARLKAGYTLGSHSDGWMLTTAGLEFARSNSGKAAGREASERPRPDDDQWKRERARLLSSDAYARLQNGAADSVTADEADAFFRLNVYVSGAGRERKIARVENHFIDDPELGAAVKTLAARARERMQ
jgi:uncharacterized protein YfiM (DUF2279 family)